MEMMHQVWAAGLHDAANCFLDALEAKWKLESQPKTNGDRIRAMTDEELAQLLSTGTFICEGLKDICEYMPGCEVCRLAWLRSPANDGGNEK